MLQTIQILTLYMTMVLAIFTYFLDQDTDT